MQKLILTLLLAFLLSAPIGCTSQVGNEYIEGTSLTLGLYLPMNGTVYGLQCINYLSGKRVKVATNGNFKIDSVHAVTNSAFGIFDVSDYSKT